MLTAIIYSALSGVGAAAIGGAAGLLLRKSSGRALGALLAFSCGLAAALAVAGLLPEALILGNLALLICSCLFGACAALVLSDAADSLSKRNTGKAREQKLMLRAGLTMSASVAALNLVKGLAIGSGELIDRGQSLSLLLGAHNLAQCAALAGALSLGGLGAGKTLFLCVLSGCAVTLGTAAGYVFGSLSPYLISTFLGTAAGAVLLTCFSDLFLRANAIYRGRLPSVVLVAGMLAGIAVLKLFS